MKIMITDQKKRITLPGAQPGEVFSVRPQKDGGYICVRLVEAPRAAVPSRDEVFARMEQSGLTPRLGWDELRSITREC